MIPNSNMIFKVLRLIPQIILSSLFFFPIMHQRDHVDLKFSGIEAILQGDYFIVGNIVILLVMLGVILHLVTIFVEMIYKQTNAQWISRTNMIVNLTMILGLVMVTFLGTLLEPLGYVIIVLLISTTYIRYLEQKKNE